MMKTIRTYDELMQEKKRLNALLAAQKELVRQDVRQIKLEFTPVRNAVSTLGKFATRKKSNFLLNSAANTFIDIVVKNLLLSRAGWITKLALPFVMKNFSSHVIADNKDKIVNKLSSFFGGGKKNTNGRMPQQREPEITSDEEED